MTSLLTLEQETQKRLGLFFRLLRSGRIDRSSCSKNPQFSYLSLNVTTPIRIVQEIRLNTSHWIVYFRLCHVNTTIALKIEWWAVCWLLNEKFVTPVLLRKFAFLWFPKTTALRKLKNQNQRSAIRSINSLRDSTQYANSVCQ